MRAQFAASGIRQPKVTVRLGRIHLTKLFEIVQAEKSSILIKPWSAGSASPPLIPLQSLGDVSQFESSVSLLQNSNNVKILILGQDGFIFNSL